MNKKEESKSDHASLCSFFAASSKHALLRVKLRKESAVRMVVLTPKSVPQPYFCPAQGKRKKRSLVYGVVSVSLGATHPQFDCLAKDRGSNRIEPYNQLIALLVIVIQMESINRAEMTRMGPDSFRFEWSSNHGQGVARTPCTHQSIFKPEWKA